MIFSNQLPVISWIMWQIKSLNRPITSLWHELSNEFVILNSFIFSKTANPIRYIFKSDFNHHTNSYLLLYIVVFNTQRILTVERQGFSKTPTEILIQSIRGKKKLPRFNYKPATAPSIWAPCCIHENVNSINDVWKTCQHKIGFTSPNKHLYCENRTLSKDY